MSIYELEFVNLNNPKSVNQVSNFLDIFNLTYDQSEIEFTVLLHDNDEIIATGSFFRNTLKNIAIKADYQGKGLTARIVSELIQELARRGRFHYFLYTKPELAWLFCELGLKEIVRGQYAALLEGGIGSLTDYLAQVRQQTEHLPVPRAALVMNCNPFTLGHRFLIEQAASLHPAVIVFVVSEEGTDFSFVDRIALVKAGTADLTNVVVVPTGPYQVSNVTFPTYFTKAEYQTQASTELDVKLFGEIIAPALNINHRYIGDEPYCAVTASYNQTIAQLLPELGVNVTIVPRKIAQGQVISASLVRAKLSQQDWSGLKALLPTTTYDYLQLSQQ